MKAAIYREFGQAPLIEDLPDPAADDGGVVVDVKACGICRSDWLGWMGGDPDITLPHVPGHELAGVIAEAGAGVEKWRPGDRITVPFVGGCGNCPQCASGNQQICDRQFQPGFTHWGAFAEKVFVDHADENLVLLPDDLAFVTAASLGCRFATAFRAVADQGRVAAGEWVAVFGCGGVGLAAVMIAKAFGAKVIGVDIDDGKLEFAREIGADLAIRSDGDAARRIKEQTGGGANISVEAIGLPEACFLSVSCLRKQGRHIQVGLPVTGDRETPVPLDLIVANELEIRGSHGMQAHRYPEMMEMIANGSLHPEKLVGKTVSLAESIAELTGMNEFAARGMTVIDSFDG